MRACYDSILDWQAVRRLRSSWLNIDNRVGYIVLRQPERENVMRHHDFASAPSPSGPASSRFSTPALY